MPNFAIHDGINVVNVIVADSLELAESITGMQAVEANSNGPGIGWLKDEQGWKTPDSSPYPSWHWDYQQLVYAPPVPRPGDNYYWDEEAQEWKPAQHFPSDK